ncbi:transporter [Kushneria pakistanensis]|uniref:Transporter n=1 Tax=Kushneria pakistanensis TaxID=1508770 RepID=A0ABQ3FFJ0_9GAMM|nr:AEC family transporter [Kushneria pakistanensis]GHC21971.1 transporter [Kushneria pakistanensis]
MSSIVDALAPLFALIALGAVLGWARFPGGDFWPRLERFIYYLLFPAMLVATLATADVRQVSVLPLAVTLLGAMLLLGAGLWLARARLALTPAVFTSAFQGVVRFNTYVGVAGAGALYGEAGLTVAAVAIALMVPTANILCVLAFVVSGTVVSDNQGQARIVNSVLALARNPLILACLAGVALNASGIGLPGVSAPALELLGQAALPLGLVAVGVALRPKALWRGGRAFWLSSVLKLVITPMLVLCLAWLSGLHGVDRHVALLFAALPTATSAYILARQLGGDAELMAAIITGQTLLAMLTMPVMLQLLGVS